MREAAEPFRPLRPQLQLLSSIHGGETVQTPIVPSENDVLVGQTRVLEEPDHDPRVVRKLAGEAVINLQRQRNDADLEVEVDDVLN